THNTHTTHQPQQATQGQLPQITTGNSGGPKRLRHMAVRDFRTVVPGGEPTVAVQLLGPESTVSMCSHIHEVLFGEGCQSWDRPTWCGPTRAATWCPFLPLGLTR